MTNGSGTPPPATYDAVIVGAGFAGMYMLYRLRGEGFSVTVLEAADGVGGTWYWNRYPGARCDVESMQYSFQFDEALQQEWAWTERYATQPEILRYANHVADRFDLRRDIQFETRVTAARFDEDANRWAIETGAGARLSARFCIMATGCLSLPNTPNFDGIDSFTGDTYHTGLWPHEGVDFTGQNVGVIGTGSSAIQSIPLIAEQAKHLTVFQRTPHYTVPAHNQPLDPEMVRQIKDHYSDYRAQARAVPPAVLFPVNEDGAVEVSTAERQRVYEQRWDVGGVMFMGSFNDLLFSAEANESAAAFVRSKISEAVPDPEIAELLSPHTIIGCKRLCVDTGYYATYTRPNVSLVDVRDTPIEALTPSGIRVGDQEYAFDSIVFATGFDAMTGALLKIDIRGREGRKLKDKWHGGPRTYLGLGVEGFPNLFTITGPGSPSVLANMIVAIEQHVDWIVDCLRHLRDNGLACIEATREAEDAWVAHVNEVADGNLRSTCSSWYVGANIPGKPRLFMPYIGGFPVYAEKCQVVAAKGYDGFALSE
ncbi:MAG: NAD(P)/FAD-dependent oxidoreductase [Alphaproteobacteria bacterium]